MNNLINKLKKITLSENESEIYVINLKNSSTQISVTNLESSFTQIEQALTLKERTVIARCKIKSSNKLPTILFWYPLLKKITLWETQMKWNQKISLKQINVTILKSILTQMEQTNK